VNSQPSANPSNSASWFHMPAITWSIAAAFDPVLGHPAQARQRLSRTLEEGPTVRSGFDYDVVLDGRTSSGPVNYAWCGSSTGADFTDTSSRHRWRPRTLRARMSSPRPATTATRVGDPRPKANHPPHRHHRSGGRAPVPGIGAFQAGFPDRHGLDAGHPFYIHDFFFPAPLPAPDAGPCAQCPTVFN